MKKIFLSQCAFLLPALVFWILVLGLVLWTNKPELHQTINQWNTPFADFFLKYYTHSGGSFPFLVAAVLLFWRYSASIMILATQLIATVFVTPLKHLMDEDRPRVVFEHLHQTLHTVPAVQLHSSLSFPSGHTAAAFALFFSLSLLVKQPMLQFAMFLLAVLAGFSRVYLSQHFTEDVLAGSFIGVMSVIIYYYFFQQKTDRKLGKKSLRDLL